MTTPRDFRPLLMGMHKDVEAFLKNDPTSIKALLFRALRSQVEQLTDEQDEVGTMEASDKIFEYADPVPAFALELPFDFPVPMDTADAHGSGYFEEPVAMLLSESNVPKGSVLLYDEYDNPYSDEPVRRILYVERIQGLSKHPGGVSVYFLMPFLDYDERFANAQ